MLFPEIDLLKPVSNYKLKIKFADGVEGVYDLSSMAGKGVFKSWDSDSNFFAASVDKETGAIKWPGDIEIDTLAVYCQISGISPDEYLKLHAGYAAD